MLEQKIIQALKFFGPLTFINLGLKLHVAGVKVETVELDKTLHALQKRGEVRVSKTYDGWNQKVFTVQYDN